MTTFLFESPEMQPHLLAFAAIALGLAVTPGPNMMYLVSRSLCQGKVAGLISLVGVAAAFVVYLACSVLGITALAFGVPIAFDALRLAGACYLGYLAWQVLKPGGRSPFTVAELSPVAPRRLLLIGFLTNLLNPKAAMLYVSLLPQFIDAKTGNVLIQSTILGLTQMMISMTVNATLILAAGSFASALQHHPRWEQAQRWLMGSVLGVLAVRMAIVRAR